MNIRSILTTALFRGLSAGGTIILAWGVCFTGSVEQLGETMVSLSVVIGLGVVATLGMDGYCLRELSLAAGANDLRGASRTYSNAIGRVTIAGTALGIAIIFTSLCVRRDHFFFNNGIPIGIAVPVTAIVSLQSAALRGMGRPEPAAMLELGSISLVATIILLALNGIDAGISISPIASFACASLVLMLLGRYYITTQLNANIKGEQFAISLRRFTLRESRDYYIQGLIGYSLGWGSTLAVSLSTSTADAGIYGVAQRVALILLFPTVVASGVFLPGIAVLHARKEPEALQQGVLKIARPTLIATAFMAIALSISNEYVMSAFELHGPTPAITLSLLILSFYINAIFVALNINILNICGMPKNAYKARLMAGGTGLALIGVGGLLYGVIGAAVSTTITTIFLAILTAKNTTKHLGIPGRCVFIRL